MILPTQPIQPTQIQQVMPRKFIRLTVSHHWLTYLDDEGYRVYEVTELNERREEFITKDPLQVVVDKIKERYGVQVLYVYCDYSEGVM